MSKKVDLEILIEEMIDRVRETDSDDTLTQSEKTKTHRRTAESFKNKLHDDKRRAAGSKISLTTYRRYLTRARNAVTEQNWKHHSLEQALQSICNKYPDLSEKLTEIVSIKDLTKMRKAHHAFCLTLTKDDDKYQAVKDMKLDHEVMRWLTLTAAQKAALNQTQSDALEHKKTNVVWMHGEKITSGIIDLITKKTKTVDKKQTFAFSRLTFGIALATGRRRIEVVRQGVFKKIDDERIEFSGHAKKRGGPDYDHKSIIYSLVPVDLVMEALKNLRDLPEIHELDQYNELPLTEQNIQIDRRIAQVCNTQAKAFFNDRSRVFKDSRAIWARIVHDKYFATDPAWKDADEDVFWREMLGHEDIETQKSYKQFKIVYGQAEEEDEGHQPAQADTERLDALNEFDDHDEIVEGRAMQRLHNNVKMAVKASPDFIITQSSLSREFGTSRPVIKRYLEIVGDAIEPKTKTESGSDDLDQKPALKAEAVGDGIYEAWAMLGDIEIDRIRVKGSYMDAMKALWSKIKNM